MHDTNSNVQQTDQMLSKHSSIRILHVTGGMPRAGAETWLMNILRNIDRDNFKMDFLVHTTDECAYDKEIRALGSNIISIELSTPWKYGSSFKQVLRKNGPYDIVHSHPHHFSGYVLRLAEQEGVPVRIAQSHLNSSSLESKSSLYRRLYIALTKRWIQKYATVGLAASDQALWDLFDKTSDTDPRWQLLYYGINLGDFRDTVGSAAVRAELGIPWDAFVVGHVGRFHPQKNHHFIVDIAVEIAKREPKMCLLLLGEGSLMPDIKQKLINKGLAHNVIFTGSRPDVARIMLGAMDTFLFPSLYEGLGIVLLEAQAAGLPCIISDVIPEEADVVTPLMQRLSLSEPASVWAENVLATSKTASNIAQPEALELMEKSFFNIETSRKTLERIYRVCCNKS